MARHPEKYPCERCECKQGYAPFARWIIEGEATKRCPRQEVTEQAEIFIGLYSHYRNGLLPFGGGILNQPNPYLRAMEVLDAEVNNDADRS